MKTKLVYVLTCNAEGNFIEQAYISIYSARHYNPEAHIVLITEQTTDEQFVGRRADLLQYISEKIVVKAPSEYNMLQKSRWLKTSVRNLIDGDYLFIDSDTIITCNLSEIDNFTCDIGAVLDCHSLFCDIPENERRNLYGQCEKCGWNISILDNYTSSGVTFVRDNKRTHDFYSLWHNNWIFSSSNGVNQDQLSFAQANSEISLISLIDDTWNTIMFMRPSFVNDAKILHFSVLENNSFLFSKRVLNQIRDKGLTDYLKTMILNPHHTYIPFLKEDYSEKNFFKTLHWVSKAAKQYGQNIDNQYDDIHIKSRFSNTIKKMYRHGLYKSATLFWMLRIKTKKKYGTNSI